MTFCLPVDAVCRYRVAWLVVLVLLAICGCGQEVAEEQHLEHLIPEHKPASFAEAITQLDARSPEVLAGQAAEEARQQFVEIIDWLPELAADSDLRRQQWEQVRDTGLRLRQIVTTPAQNASQSNWDELVAGLRMLVPESERRVIDQ